MVKTELGNSNCYHYFILYFIFFGTKKKAVAQSKFRRWVDKNHSKAVTCVFVNNLHNILIHLQKNVQSREFSEIFYLDTRHINGKPINLLTKL